MCLQPLIFGRNRGRTENMSKLRPIEAKKSEKLMRDIPKDSSVDAGRTAKSLPGFAGHVALHDGHMFELSNVFS